jgi:hypothetical protein
MISSYQTHNCDLPSPLVRDLNKAGILHRSTSKENPALDAARYPAGHAPEAEVAARM